MIFSVTLNYLILCFFRLTERSDRVNDILYNLKLSYFVYFFRLAERSDRVNDILCNLKLSYFVYFFRLAERSDRVNNILCDLKLSDFVYFSDWQNAVIGLMIFSVTLNYLTLCIFQTGRTQ